MENLENLHINTDDMSFSPITNIDIILKDGAKIKLSTPLRINDFLELWNTRKRKVKIITGKESFAYINKHYVMFYHIYPIEK